MISSRWPSGSSKYTPRPPSRWLIAPRWFRPGSAQYGRSCARIRPKAASNSSSPTRKCPNLVAGGRPRMPVRNAADRAWSRHETMVWFSCTLILVILPSRGACLAGAAVQRGGEAAGVGAGDLGDGGEDVPVAGAAAQHAGQLRGEFRLGHLRLMAEQVIGAEQEAGRA